MLSVAIAEDEAAAREQLQMYLEQWQTESGRQIQVSCFESGTQLLQNLPEELQLVFLDIQMPGLNGMETARSLRQKMPDVELVFITSLTGYALESYDVAALDYLVKPVSYPRLCRSIERASRRITRREENILTVKNNDGVFRIPVKDLLYVEVFSHRLVLHTTDQELSYSGGTLAALEKRLGENFFRCHSSFLLNLEQVTQLDGNEVVLGQHRIPVSKYRRKALLAAMAACWGETL